MIFHLPSFVMGLAVGVVPFLITVHILMKARLFP
jgi:hypothetical protein